MSATVSESCGERIELILRDLELRKVQDQLETTAVNRLGPDIWKYIQSFIGPRDALEPSHVVDFGKFRFVRYTCICALTPNNTGCKCTCHRCARYDECPGYSDGRDFDSDDGRQDDSDEYDEYE